MEERASQEDLVNKDVDVEQRIRMIKGIAGIISCDMNQDENTRAAVEAIFELAGSIEKEIHAEEEVKKLETTTLRYRNPLPPCPDFTGTIMFWRARHDCCVLCRSRWRAHHVFCPPRHISYALLLHF